MYQLSQTQREILRALIETYDRAKSYVKSRDVARHIGRDEGTVRNIILSLKSLGLVSSKTGPCGGYMPTLKAYEVMRSESLSRDRHEIRIYLDGRSINAWVSSIEILDPLSPEGGRIILRVHGDLSPLTPGSHISLGPPGKTRIILEGKILNVDDNSRQVLLVSTRFASIPSEKVGSVASRSLIMLSPDVSIVEAAKILYTHGIKGAPVTEKGRVVGIFTMTDLARAVIKGDTTSKVSEYMSRKIVSIRDDEELVQAVYLMNKHSVGRLLVINHAGEPIGIVTRTDLLRRIAGFD